MSVEITSQLSSASEDVNAASASAGSTPEAEVTPIVANFGEEFRKELRLEILAGMGEGEYREMMESLLEDLQLGLESHRAEQMGETVWRMRRSQRMGDGLALKNIKVPGKDMAAMVRSSQAFDALFRQAGPMSAVDSASVGRSGDGLGGQNVCENNAGYAEIRDSLEISND